MRGAALAAEEPRPFAEPPPVFLAEAPRPFAEPPPVFFAEAPPRDLAEADAVFFAEAPPVFFAEAPPRDFAEADAVFFAEAVPGFFAAAAGVFFVDAEVVFFAEAVPAFFADAGVVFFAEPRAPDFPEALFFAEPLDVAEGARCPEPEAARFVEAEAVFFAPEPARFAVLAAFAAAAPSRVPEVADRPPSRALPSRLLERRTFRERGRLEKTSVLESSAIG